RINNLQHTTTRNGTYSSALINGLTPGTRYRGWVQIRNLEGWVVGPVGQPAGSENEYFYTKNTVSSLSAPTLNSPVAEHGATAEFSVDYQAAGDHPDQPAAHPNNVKVYLSTDGVAFSEISSHQTSPSIDTFDIDTTNKKATVKIKNLTAGQTYYVKCSVVNQGGESEQTPVRMFTTNPRQAGLYISDTPTFNFGVQSVNSSGITARLSNTQGTAEFGIKMENVGISSNWSFAARLSSLRTQDGSNQELTGAQLSFGKQLQKTTDGTTWQDVTQDFEGLGETTAILPADHSTTQLWKSTDISAGQGKFRTTIAFDSVNLLIPGNTAQKGAFYEGKIEWLMVNEP
ncbi:MAG: WxL domain-containing protein, partial [Enterococcus hulanensis]